MTPDLFPGYFPNDPEGRERFEAEVLALAPLDADPDRALAIEDALEDLVDPAEALEVLEARGLLPEGWNATERRFLTARPDPVVFIARAVRRVGQRFAVDDGGYESSAFFELIGEALQPDELYAALRVQTLERYAETPDPITTLSEFRTRGGGEDRGFRLVYEDRTQGMGRVPMPPAGPLTLKEGALVAAQVVPVYSAPQGFGHARAFALNYERVVTAEAVLRELRQIHKRREASPRWMFGPPRFYEAPADLAGFAMQKIQEAFVTKKLGPVRSAFFTFRPDTTRRVLQHHTETCRALLKLNQLGMVLLDDLETLVCPR